MTHMEIFTKLQGNWNPATNTLHINLNGKETYVPNSVVKEVRLS